MMYPQSDAILDKKTGETLIYSELLKGNREVMPSGYPMHPQSGVLRSKYGDDIDLVELLSQRPSGEGGGTAAINDNNISKYTTYSSQKIENIKSEVDEQFNTIKSEIKDTTRTIMSEDLLNNNMIKPELLPLDFSKSNPSINLFNKNDTEIVWGKYYLNGWKDGSIGTIGGTYSTSGFIPVELGETYTQKYTNTVTSYWNSEKQFVLQGSMDKTFTVPSDERIKYIRICFLNSEIDNIMFIKGKIYPDEYVEYSSGEPILVLNKSNCSISEDLLPTQTTPSTDDIGSQWKGKKWYACGTSMTSTSWGRYTPYLQSLSGLVEVNLGVPNGTIANTSYPSIQNSLLNIGDDADLITLECGVNDWAYNVPLGQFGDTEPTTYYGALYTAFELLTKTSKARIVTFTMHYGVDRTDLWMKNSNGVLQKEFNEAMIKMSEMYSIPCIRVAEESGIGKNRYELYLRDNIHHTDLGGQVFAEYVWSKLKYIDLLKIV